MALSVVYFRLTHRLDRPRYVLDEFLYGVLEEVEVRATVCVILLWSVGWWWKEGRRWNPVSAHSLFFSKSTKGATRLNVPFRRTVLINSTIGYAFSTYITAEGFGILSRPVMHNLAIRKCTSPPLLAPRLKIFQWKFTTSPGIEPRTHRTRGRHVRPIIWASAARFFKTCRPYNNFKYRFHGKLFWL